MNLDLESPEETVLEPEVLTDETVTNTEDPAALLKQLEVCQTRFSTLKPVDDLTTKQVAALVETCAFASRHAEARRTAITDPLNKEVKETNAIWQPIVKGFAELARGKGAEVAKFIDDQRKAAQRAQQKEIDDAKAKQDELNRKAEAERAEADRLRMQAEEAESEEEKAKLNKQADKVEAKAETLDLKASQVVTQVVPQMEKAIDLGSSTLSARAPKKVWILAGWDKAKPLRVTDPRLEALVGDFAKLPEGVQFLLRHADLNPVYLNKSFGVIPFPAPFAETDDYGSSVRGK